MRFRAKVGFAKVTWLVANAGKYGPGARSPVEEEEDDDEDDDEDDEEGPKAKIRRQN